ncbi:MAG TPA: VWA domain-containing protein [Sedimentisphaerales bacterium]|nr:VWA domain-containing protein [Sedimentisphaerales bacterium]
MEWLTPLTALYAAAAAVPVLLLLYFLKLKRREQLVSCTLLWKRAVQDLQVNAPFQRIRRNILLLLQLLMLAAVLLALGGPLLSRIAAPGRRFVLLIDRSASMSAADVKPTRLDDAKKQAELFVQSVGAQALFSLGAKSDLVMVIAFDDHPKVMCNFTSDKRQLVAAIEAIMAGHGGSSLAEAVVVARAFAQSPGLEPDSRTTQEPARLVLFSDGRIPDLKNIVVASDELVFNCTGRSADNIAVTAMQARRTYESPDEINVFATLINYGYEQAACDVQLSLNTDVRAVRSVTIPPRSSDSGPDANEPGKVALNFTLSHADAAVIEVRQLQPDALSCDDAAWAVVSPPRRLSVLLVTAGNIVLESGLRASPLAKLDVRSPAQFDAMDHAALSVDQPYDVIVLDNHVPGSLPKCRYLIFGRPPAGSDVAVAEQVENQVIVDWRPKHAVLQYVNLTNLFAAKSFRMTPPRDAEVLAEFNETPALVLVRRQGSTFLIAGFDVLQTNWPFEPGFVLFCYNAVSFLGTEAGQKYQTNLQVGEPIVVDGLTPGATARISGPYLPGTEVTATPAGSIRFSGDDRVGLYSVAVPDQPLRMFAVNLLDASESDIKPVGEIVMSGQIVQARQQPVSRANLPLWPWLVGLALALACLEWLVYNKKVRI